MAPKFGIIQSPGFPRVGSHQRTNCLWELYSGIGQEIIVTVHLSYSRTSKRDCQSLQVDYVTCKEKKVISTPYLCRMQNINMKFRSCGNVYIRNVVGSDQSPTHDQYLISYQGNIKSKSCRCVFLLFLLAWTLQLKVQILRIFTPVLKIVGFLLCINLPDIFYLRRFFEDIICVQGKHLLSPSDPTMLFW